MLAGFFSLQEERVVSSDERLKEKLRETKKGLARAERQLQSEEARLRREYDNAIKACKLASKKGEPPGIVRMKAKQACGLVKQRERCVKTQMLLQSSRSRIQQVQTASTLANSMRVVCRCLTLMNKCYNLKEFTQLLQRYEKENFKANEMEEKVEEAMQSMDDGEEDELESMADHVMQQVADEVGLDLERLFGNIPRVSGTSVDTEFDRRFDRAWNKCDGDADILLNALLPSVPTGGLGGGNDDGSDT